VEIHFEAFREAGLDRLRIDFPMEEQEITPCLEHHHRSVGSLANGQSVVKGWKAHRVCRTYKAGYQFGNACISRGGLLYLAPDMADEKERKTLDERNQMSDLERLRHSCAHVLATAISRLWPDAQFAAGPPVEGGFYYDVDLKHRITPADFDKIEAEMKAVVKSNDVFERIVVSRDEAMKLAQSGRLASVAERDVPSIFKVDLLNDIPEGEEISIFQNGDFWDLCAGPHVGRTGNCKAFKVMSVASAFYKGDKDKQSLQRIYGTCFKNRTLLDEHLERLEEAKKRDHRRLGKEMNLFTFDESVGQGLPLWKPKGGIIRRQLQDFITEELDKQGYFQVFTPHIGKLDLYRTSGHFPYYEDSQFPPIVERDAMKTLAADGAKCSDLVNFISTGEIEGFLLKPMNCPHHIKIYDSEHRSYRDLPVRLAEFGTVYRWEQSGELGGLTRVRSFTQDDAHLFCTPEQLGHEIQGCLGLVKKVLGTLGMTEYGVRLSLRDPDSDKYVGDPENWEKAESALREAVETLGVDYTEELGEAAFYGPKIDFVVKDVIGRDWQLGTVQVDYNLPERFNLSYIGPDNKAHRPVMIHRAPFGSLERFVGLLIEHFEGKFPTWLAPEQVRVLPISEKFEDEANALVKILADRGVRVAVDHTGDKIGAKIRLARMDRVPYLAVLGAREVEENSVSVRHRDQGDLGSIPTDDFVQKITNDISSRSL
jgi:threonyl-tRNA synthetase